MPVPDDRLLGVNIARVSTVPYFVVTQLRNQLEYLACRSGARVYIVTSPGNELDDVVENRNLRKELIEIRRDIALFRDAVAVVKLWRFFRREQIDIMHSTTPKAGLISAVAAFCARVPVRLHTFTGQPWISMAGMSGMLARGADRLISFLNTRCYADSRSQADVLVRNKIISGDKIRVLGRGSLAGVDLSRFDPSLWGPDRRQELREELGIGVHAFVILFVGRITRDKGIDELLRSFRRVAKAEKGIHLVLVGPMDEEAGGTASVSRRQLTRYPDVHYLGFDTCPEKYMAIADILCLPSYREGFGTVVIEAAAMETPTVGSRIYGLSDAVVDGETGILVPPGDVDSLAGAIRQLVRDRVLCRRLGKNARRHVEMYYDARTVNRYLMEEYRSLGIFLKYRKSS